jgi:hypothetical protein
MMELEAYDPGSLFGDLLISRASFLVKLSEDLGEDSYLGSAFRGLMGWQIQAIACPFPARQRPMCKKCIVRQQCPSYILMEDKSPLPGLSDSPRPYILYPKGIDPKTRLYRLELTLVGDSSRFFPLLVKCMEKGRRIGLGSRRVSYEIQGEFSNHDELKTARLSELLSVPQAEDIFVFLSTPLRLRKKGIYLAESDWRFFLETAARRFEALSVLYGNGKPLGNERWMALSALFANAPLPQEENLKWLDYSRRSNHQRREVPMGGLVGKAFFRNTPEWVRSWFAAASLLHVGKGAAMGLGKIEIAKG